MLDTVLEDEPELARTTGRGADRSLLRENDLLSDRPLGVGGFVEENPLKSPLSPSGDLVDEDDVTGDLVEEDARPQLRADVAGVQDLALHETRLVARPRLDEG